MTIIKRQSYDVDTNDMSVYVNDFELSAAQDFIQSLLQLEKDPLLSDIFVYVTSYGGDCSGLTAMIEAIKNSSKNVHMIGMGYNYSAGGLLIMTGPRGNRWIGKNSFLHIHEVQDVIFGSTTNIKRSVKHLEMIQERLFDLLVQNSLLTIDLLKSKIKEHDGEWLITPHEALELELIDRIGIPKVKVSTIWELES